MTGTGRVIARPSHKHDCSPGWTTKTGSDGRPYGIPPSSWDYPEGTVWACPCGKTWVSGMRAEGSFFARWHPESRWARWRRTRKAG